MSTETTITGFPPLCLKLGPLRQKMTEDDFFQFCQANRDLRIERTSQGEIILMPPAGGDTGNFNARVTARLTLWAEADGSGVPFDSSTGFVLPNGAERSPDFAWVRRSRWERLTPAEQQKFPPLCPDFVVEIRSPTDRLSTLQAKMEEYLENGAQMGWLIDPGERCLYVYRAGAEVERLETPSVVGADPVLPGCTIDFQPLWK